MNESAVECTNVAIRRGERLIFERLTVAIAAGEFVGIIGGNGTGKSTLLQMILGLVAPSAGSVRVFGSPPAQRHGGIGYVPQRIELDPGLPLRACDFVALGIEGTRFGIPLPNSARDARVRETLADVGATELATMPIGRLSGGEQQRLALAQAIVGRPRLLLLDEPLANLDLRSAAEIVALVARIGRERNITVLLVAHDVNPLMRVMDRVLYLARGRAAIGTIEAIVNEDTLSRLYDRPVDVLRVRGRVIVVAGDDYETASR